MVSEPSHIDGGVLDLVLTDVPDVLWVQVRLSVGTSDHRAVFVYVVLEQPILQLVCRQEVFLRNSVDWELVRGYVKGPNWNGIITSHCSASSLNKALLCVIRDRVPKQTFVVITGDKHCCEDRCVLAHRAKQRACRVWGNGRTQAD